MLPEVFSLKIISKLEFKSRLENFTLKGWDPIKQGHRIPPTAF
jgi:hypothetical protein